MAKQKVFCIGFSKTGTTSIEHALNDLGYKVLKGHWANNTSNYGAALYVNNDIDELLKLTTNYDAFADAPWGGSRLYRKLHEVYPDAKFIFTRRDPERWYRSFETMMTEFTDNTDDAFDSMFRNHMYGTVYYFSHLFGIKTLTGNKKKIIDTYKEINDEIEVYFKGNPNFLRMDVVNGDGWELLCPFLGEKQPEWEFYHMNKAHNAREENPKPTIKTRIREKLVIIINNLLS